MKVIDLLNMIANGEEVPKYIRFDTEMYSLNPNNHYVRECGDFIQRLDIEYNLAGCLNDEVEIIEEKKEIEKLDIQTNNGGSLCLRNEAGTLCGMNKHSIVMAKKINELIDEVNKLKEEKWNN